MRKVNAGVIEKLRSGASLNGMPRERMLLLTTTGRRSGREHTVPMMFTTVGDTVVVVASNSGSARHPDWYLNLVADPDVVVERGGERYRATARVVSSDRRPGVWTKVVEQIPMYAAHQSGTAREIPLVELVPSPAAR